jgi:two-component system, sensor histidine kinase RpfC
MNVNFIEGIHDKTEQGLRKILLAQAKVRLGVAIPVIIADLILFFTTPGGVPLWFLCLTAGYSAYAISPYWLTYNATAKSLQNLLIASAITDPLVLSVWIALTGKFGSLIAGFYLFTTLGFGFRTGRQLMYLCQAVSIAAFFVVLGATAYWQENPVIWCALLVPIIVVPFYAATLIKTLREAREHAEQESRAKSELLAKVSHELRTPLTGIVATAELLSLESVDRAVIRRTETILTLSDNLLSEINDLLDEAKYDAAALELSVAPVDLVKKIAVLRTTFEAMAAKKGVNFRADIDPGVTDLVVGDGHHLNRVLLNLAGNAVKFTDRGVVRLGVDLIRQTSDAYDLRFSVTDTGIGIPESFHAKMFQPFSQVEQGTNRRFGGTGLGLTLSKRTVALMGGDLQFESSLGKGSRFWFDLTLPRRVQEQQAPAVPRSDIIPPKRILVAEDNITNLILIQEMLHVDHHEVITCTSGIAALEALVKQDFDLLLLDYNLGDMDGVRVLQTYQFGKLHAAPAIFLTADATVQTANRLKSAGGAGILYKPVSLAGLRKALAQIDFSNAPHAEPEREIANIPEPARTERPVLKIVPTNPLDMEIIDQLRSVNARPGFIAMLLSHAQTDISRSSDQLCEALAGRNTTLVHSIAHTLKGVSANVGAVRVATLATGIMNMSSDEIDSARDRLAADLRDSSNAALAALHKIAVEEPALSTNAGAGSGTGSGGLHLD